MYLVLSALFFRTVENGISDISRLHKGDGVFAKLAHVQHDGGLKGGGQTVAAFDSDAGHTHHIGVGTKLALQRTSELRVESSAQALVRGDKQHQLLLSLSVNLVLSVQKVRLKRLGKGASSQRRALLLAQPSGSHHLHRARDLFDTLHRADPLAH